MTPSVEQELEAFLAALARLFAHKGASTAVAVLALGRATCEQTSQDTIDGPVEGSHDYYPGPNGTLQSDC